MERLMVKYNSLNRVHKALGKAIERYCEAQDFDTQEERRDSVIKRFELTYDLLWKYLRKYIAASQGLAFDSPRKVFQQCMQYGITNENETEQLLSMIESRNLATHTYDLDLAKDVAKKVSEYYHAIHTIIVRVAPNNAKK